ncbi:hypothetical protein D770_24040 [Flammeovirgaceae bacterium 311]|nr:hypothetical protein D770_24040 [Flammeovirgaceae bacterium 311]
MVYMHRKPPRFNALKPTTEKGIHCKPFVHLTNQHLSRVKRNQYFFNLTKKKVRDAIKHSFCAPYIVESLVAKISQGEVCIFYIF